MKFVEWVKLDFNRVSNAFRAVLNRDISKGVCLIWYLLWLPLTIWFMPAAYYFETRYVPRKLKKLEEEA